MGSSPTFRVLQPTDVGQVLDVPALHTDDSGVDPALDVFREAAEASENVRMDWVEDQVLTGAPVSAADRAAWRRWANEEEKEEEEEEEVAQNFLLSLFLAPALRCAGGHWSFT